MATTNPALREALEKRIGSAIEVADWNAVTTLVLEGYGPEILSLLFSLHRDGGAEEVFSLFAEGVWRGAPGFKGQCTVRTWAYAIARNASSQYRRESRRRNRRFEPFANDSILAEVEARIRTETMSFLRTAARSKLGTLRDELPLDDQLLLMLRVDRKLAWDDLVRVLRADDADELSTSELKREAARLRKRFQLVTQRLRARAKAMGLLDGSGGDV